MATTAIGGGLTWAPEAVARSLGLRRPEPARIIGLADLALVPGLIAGRPRWPWMAARAALNVAIAAYLLDDARRTSASRPRSAALVLAAITVADCTTARRLRAGERRPGRAADARVAEHRTSTSSRLDAQGAHMTTLDPADDYLVLINTFTVDPERADELLDVLSEATEEAMVGRPGFVSANLHVSTDRRRVANYAQWRSQADYDAMMADPAAFAHMRRAADIADGFDPIYYELRSVHEGRSSDGGDQTGADVPR